MKTFVVRDHRNKAMFRVDDEYLNGYAKLCGIYATGVYNCLCRHSNHLTQSAFPSVEMMADKLGVSKDSVLRGIKNLEEWGIIRKEKSRSDKTGKWLHNSYTLIDKSLWKPKPDQVADSDVVHQVANSGSPSRSQHTIQVAHSDTKVAHIKDTHIKDSEHSSQDSQPNLIGELIKLFESVDPKNKTYYGNKTQRAACEFLLGEYGFDRVSRAVEMLPEINSRKLFIGQTTTPFELKQNWVKIGNAIKQEKSIKNKQTPNYIL